MILDGILILILVFAAIRGKKMGLFRVITKALSFVIAALASYLLHEKVNLFLQKTPFYQSMVESLKEKATEAFQNGNLLLFRPFVESAEAIPAQAAEKMAGTIVSVFAFILIYFAVKFLIQFLNKTVFHLPIIKPINHVLGSIWSVAFTLIVLYLVIALLGTLSVFSSSAFMEEQMLQSFLVRRMFTNNLVLNFIF